MPASILMLDREPIRWAGGRRAGLGWVAWCRRYRDVLAPVDPADLAA